MTTRTSELAQDLIKKMLKANVQDRITMPDLLVHPFFTSMEPKANNPAIPDLGCIARPIGSLASIDPDIFANLRTLWHGTPDSEIAESLRNTEQNWQKGVYHLLVGYRNKHFVHCDEEQELANRRRRKKLPKLDAVILVPISRSQETDIGPSPSSFPNRDGPPTPRRAARSRVNSSSESLAQVHAIDFSSSPTPSPRLDSLETPVNLSRLPPLAVPDLADEKMQVFFHQIVNHLNALQVRTGMEGDHPEFPNLDLFEGMSLSGTYSAVPPSTPATIHEQRGDGSGSSIGTRPLSVRRKIRPQRLTVDTRTSNKENVENHFLDASIAKKSSLRSNIRQKAPGIKKVQIVEPTLTARSSKLKKRKASPTSPAFSDGSSFTLASPSLSSPLPSSPKRSWLGNVFNFKPVTHTLSSIHDIHITRNECRRLLMRMDVRVVLEDAEGLGVLKCRLDEVRDPNGLMSVVKAVKFRVEVCRPSEDAICQVSLFLVHEKGSMDSFKEVYKRLQRDWDMDDADSPLHHAISPSPVIATAVW